MKRIIWVVISISFLTISCSGDGENIEKVKNGVFSSYDNTITIGNALENNKYLKGGKWKTVEMNGRKYVTYTISLSKTKIQEIYLRIYSNLDGYENKPNFASAKRYCERLYPWTGITNDEILAEVTTLSREEAIQINNIMQGILDVYDNKQSSDIEPLFTIDMNEIIISFVMNQDDTFDINMLEIYSEVTLICFNNLKVRHNVARVDRNQRILDFIWKDTIPNLL